MPKARPTRGLAAGAAVAACLLLAGACTGGGDGSGSAGSVGTGPAGATATGPDASEGAAPAVRGDFRMPAPTAGAGASSAALRRLCGRTPAAPAPPPTQDTAAQPPIVLDGEQRVQEYRELTYLAPVAVAPVTPSGLRAQLDAAFDREHPAGLMARRSAAWSTIGVVPRGTDLRDAFHRYVTTDAGAAYDVDTNVLSFVERTDLDPVAHFGLLHELALALDDQRFALERADALLRACDDEAWAAARGAIDGSAGFFATQVALRTFAAGEQGVADPTKRISRPDGVPPFVHALRVFPDVAGPTFASIITDLGETEAINEPLSTLPVSTEQILHPAERLDDPPVPVDPPDLGPALGTGWRDLDVMDVGEEWLRAMLGLRLAVRAADDAAEGWGGGRYRAWTDGSREAVLLVTTWDTPKDAREFRDALHAWIGGDPTAAAGTTQDPSTVVGLFASDGRTLGALEGALR